MTDTVFELKLDPYLIVIYRADRIAHDEPYDLAWEVTNPKSDNPHRYLYYSTKCYALTDVQGAVQDAINAIFTR
ncbi:hypothetical protein LCGC14_1789670 [marine sediment metagenome]|uniref:Uncharacterized protein n=1 Tax=marine sediment metagenome TaxID=412755 RepID=A0A0F9HFH6_9ZZZZ